MAGEFYDFFNQLFYSHEIWGYMGIFAVIGLALLIVYRIRYSSMFFAPILAIMAIDYSIKIEAAGGYFGMHAAILYFAALMLVLYDIVERKRD